MKTVIVGIAIGVVFFAMRISSNAALGETLDQTIQRYGPVLKKTQSTHLPPSEATVQYEFFKNDFRIQVSFVNGKCAWILYMKDNQPIFETELQTLLDNNTEGSVWNPAVEERDRFTKKKIKYSRADALADATYEEMGSYHGLIIITKAWRDMTSRASGL
jgi:hypothetical protein